MNEELLNDLIAVIWPTLDAGMSKSEIEDCFINALDNWTPPPENGEKQLAPPQILD
jgi:hypothetical protein